jgi:hypothetical protein
MKIFFKVTKSLPKRKFSYFFSNFVYLQKKFVFFLNRRRAESNNQPPLRELTRQKTKRNQPEKEAKREERSENRN